MFSFPALLTVFGVAVAATEHPPAVLVVCPGEDGCAEGLVWLDGLAELEGAFLHLAEAILDADAGAWENGAPLAVQFHSAVVRAREAAAGRHWNQAWMGLEDAEHALEKWAGTADNQELFDVAFLRGVVSMGQGHDPSRLHSFQRAAALAWNRSVELPTQDEAVLTAWYTAQETMLAEQVGRLRIVGSAPDAEFYLDGVLLGPPPLEVRVFPGGHRVTAVELEHQREWKRQVVIHSQQTTALSVRFDRKDDLRWVEAQLAGAFGGQPVDGAALDLVSDWAARQHHDMVRLVMAQPVSSEPGGVPQDPAGVPDGPDFVLLQVLYDPGVRRFSAPGEVDP